MEKPDKEDAVNDIEERTMATETKSILVERLLPHAVDKVWRALTSPHLVAEWLMENDFEPVEGHRFTFRAKPIPGWSGVVNCVVLKVSRPHLLAYSWGDGSESDSGLKTIVTWSLTPEGPSTRVRMEQSGFRPQDAAGYKGMGSGWPRILEQLEQVAAGQG
ncbi:SRPBCC domain-containing protein [Mesorhizobium sp.]|uniref:SRPBCC family protein n=1 Tax=Mesorhizobium sp. TaxID=1871066 RepID=UPI00342AB82D